MNKPRRNVGRKSSASFTTRSGKTIKVNRSLVERGKARKEEKARAKAAYLSTLPKNRWKRLAYRMHPKRLAAYWFSREGAIMALKVTGIGILACFLIIVGVFAYFRKDLPKLNDISGNNIGGSITYYDRTGQTVLWQDYDAVQRYPVEWDSISQYMKDATVAIEDKNFYNHGAVDVAGLTRAVVNNATGGTTQGGSTITQQLVKLNQDWTEDRTITRKVKELILAVELERQYSKDDILKGYLNIAPYGGIEYGVEAAARNYFHTSAKDLTLAQSAFLAAIPQSPSYYSPYAAEYGYNEEALVGRMHYILDQMADQGYITKEQATEAKNTDVVAAVQPRKPKYQNMQAPYFVLAAKAELEQRWGEQTVQRGGWKVTTTLDMGLQAEAEKQVNNGLRQVQRQGGDSVAFAAADVETGQMVALVGGVDFSNEEYGQINFAQTLLPPGSSFKPYDYAALIENSTNAGAGSVIYDTQGAIPGYPCTVKTRPLSDPENANCLWDYDFRYPGPVTIRYALGGSRNVPAVKAMLMTGVEKTIDTAEAMGLVSGYNCFADESLTVSAQCYGSSAIGDGAYLKLDEHVNSFATFSRGGKYIPRTYILKIVDAGGKTISEYKQPEAKQAIREDTAYIMADMMSDPNASYLANKIHNYNGWKFAVKTGTTNDSKDGLMMGYSTKYAAGVWVGYHNRSKAMTGFMENMTTPIWNGWMKAAHTNVTAKNWDKPAGVKTEAAYVIRSSVGGRSRIPSPATDLYPSWYKAKAGGGGSQTIDKISGKIATDCTPELARETANNANTDKFSVDTFVTGSASANTTATDDVHVCGDIKPSVSVIQVGTCKANNPCTINVTPAQGTHALVDPGRADKGGGTIRLVVNGQDLGTKSAGSSGVPVSFTFTPSSAGSFSAEATIVDSVLYSGGGSATIIATAAGSDPEDD